MKLNIVKSKNCTILYAARSYRSESGKSTSKVVKRLGTVEELREKLNGEDPIEWARTQVAGMTALEKEENKHVIIDCNPMALIPKGEQRSYNGGYLFLQKIYYELGLDYICKKIAKKHKLLKYDLNGILSMLVYTRILYPGSKRSSLEDARKFLEQPECALEQVYRALSLLAGEFNEIQAGVYKRSLKLGKRNTRVVYYDLTNYFFECEEESGLRQLRIKKNFYTVNNTGIPDAKAYNKPGFETDISTTFSATSNLKFMLNYYFAGDRWSYFNDTNVQINNINDLNFGALYDINESFAIHLKANNLLLQKYDIWYGYPAQGFNAMGGFTLKF